MTRGIISFIQGDYSGTMEYNPLVFFVFPVGLMVYVKELNNTFKKLNHQLFL